MKYDVIVVGGGIIGSTAAFYLTRQGFKVALVERDQLACGTSSKSFAWINATSKTAHEDYHRLNALGLANYGALAAEFGEAALGLNPCGALKVVTKSDAAGYATAREQARLLASYDYPVTWLERTELCALEPHFEFPDDAEALFTLGDHCLNAPHFVRFMAEQLQTLGGRLFEGCAAHSLEADEEGQVRGLVCDAGTLETDNVLLAAGPGTPEVLSQLTGYDGFAARFPLRRVPGLLVTTPPAPAHRLLRHVLYHSGTTDLHLLPDFNGGLKIGADDTDGMVDADSPPDQQRRVAAILLARAKHCLPLFAGPDCLDDCAMTVGFRPYPADGHSLAGPLPGAKGLYVIATHSGITLAPALGQLLTQQIHNGETPAQLQPFTLDRIEGLG